MDAEPCCCAQLFRVFSLVSGVFPSGCLHARVRWMPLYEAFTVVYAVLLSCTCRRRKRDLRREVVFCREIMLLPKVHAASSEFL